MTKYRDLSSTEGHLSTYVYRTLRLTDGAIMHGRWRLVSDGVYPATPGGLYPRFVDDESGVVVFLHADGVGRRGSCLMTTTRPTHCQRCGRPVHWSGTRKDDRPADSVMYRGKGLCTECATSGTFGKFQMHPSHLKTNPEPDEGAPR